MSFTQKSIPIDETKLFTKLICDFSHSNPNLNSLLCDFPSLNSVKQSIRTVNNKCRVDLVSVLKEQYNATSFNDCTTKHVDENIIKILEHNSYTITTGHQLNIFASPLFLIYKIITVLAYARYLNHHIKNHHCIPCFWMASEDHDFEEINKVKIYNKNFHWDRTDPNRAVGTLPSKSILPILDDIKTILFNTSFGKQLYQLYDNSFNNNVLYSDAMRSLLTCFFHDFGLVIIDGNHKKLKRMFIYDFELEIRKSIVFKSVTKTNKLIRKQYKPHINALISNIFYLSSSIRDKIQYDGKHYFSHVHQKKWLQKELIEEIREFPENFSPNVFLRTLYQQRIMPNVLYIGGPSEISYWLQLKDVFNQMNIQFPILQLRSFFLILSNKQANFLNKYQLSIDDVFLSTDDKIKKILLKLDKVKSENFNQELDVFLSAVREKINCIDGFNLSAFGAFEKKIKREVKKIDDKILRTHKLNNKHILEAVHNLDMQLFPNHNPQEKINSFIPFFMKYGHSFFQLLIQESSVFDNKYIILTEKS